MLYINLHNEEMKQILFVSFYFPLHQKIALKKIIFKLELIAYRRKKLTRIGIPKTQVPVQAFRKSLG